MHKYSFIEWYFPPNTKFPDPLDQIGLIVTAASLVVSTDLSKYLAPLVVASHMQIGAWGGFQSRPRHHHTREGFMTLWVDMVVKLY